MVDGRAALREQIERLRRLPTMVEAMAPEVAVALERELLEQVARQEGPDGQPWPKTQAGTAALQGIRRSLTVRAVGSVIVARLVGIHARHSVGAVRGKVKRPVMPSGKIPDAVTRAIKTIADRHFARAMGAGT